MSKKNKKSKVGDASRTGNPTCSCNHVPVLMLSLKETVAATGLSRDTLYIHIRTGELPSVQVGRRRLFRVAELQAWVDRLPGAA